MPRRTCAATIVVAVLSLARLVHATPAAPATPLAALVAADDARNAIVLGAHGEVYEPDGKGAWVHRLPSTTASTLATAGRAGSVIVASGNGVVYRLAANGWSAIRLVQKGRAVLGAGSRAVAAVGRQIFALDAMAQGEPAKLAVAPGPVVAVAASARTLVVATDAGVFRLAGAKPVAIPGVPRRLRLVSERWALVERGALDLTTRKLTAWPAGLTVDTTAPAAPAPGDALVAVARSQAGLELITVRGGAVARDPLGVSGTAVGVVVDRKGRAVVALADGRIAVRDPAGWSTTQVTAEPAAEHPGAPPAASAH